jgi:hypothetical protein
MKRTILIAFGQIMPFLVVSQLNLIPKAGFNYSRLESDPDSLDTEGRLGYHFGADIRIGEKAIFMPGVHFYRIRTYTQTKSEIVESDSFSGDVLFNSFRIPVNLGFFIVQEEDFKWGLTGGPSFWIPVTVDDNDNQLSVEELMPFYLSVNATMSFQIWRISLDFLYEYGITPVYQDIPLSTSRGFSVSAGFVL